jgi:hypothetical protein
MADTKYAKLALIIAARLAGTLETVVNNKVETTDDYSLSKFWPRLVS